MSFDPYYTWLGIPPEDQPASHYRLLGIREFESNRDVIANAADRQMTYIRTLQTGRHAKWSQQLLNEISAVQICLLSEEQRAAYDAELRSGNQAGQRVVEPRLAASPPPVPGRRVGKGAKTPPPLPMSALDAAKTNAAGNGSSTVGGTQEVPVAIVPPVPAGEFNPEVPFEFAVKPNSPRDPSSFVVDAGEYGLAEAVATPRHTVPLDSALEAEAPPEKPAVAKMAPGSPFGKPVSASPSSSLPHGALAIIAGSAALAVCFAVILFGGVLTYILSRSSGGSDVAQAGDTDVRIDDEFAAANSMPADDNENTAPGDDVTTTDIVDDGASIPNGASDGSIIGGISSDDILGNSSLESPATNEGFGRLPPNDRFGSTESGEYDSPGDSTPAPVGTPTDDYEAPSEESPTDSRPDRVDASTVDTEYAGEPRIDLDDVAGVTPIFDFSERLPEPTGDDLQRAADLQRQLRDEFDTLKRSANRATRSSRFRPRTKFPLELHSKVNSFLSRGKSASDPVERWAYLQSAREHSEEIHNHLLALGSVNALVARFDVDEVALRMEFFRKFMPLAKDGQDDDKLLFAREALSYANTLIEQDDFGEAEFLCSSAVGLATDAKDNELVREAREKQQEAHKLRLAADAKVDAKDDAVPTPISPPLPPTPKS